MAIILVFYVHNILVVPYLIQESREETSMEKGEKEEKAL